MQRGPAATPPPLRFVTSFVGRDALGALVLRALDEHRLVTLIGPPGVGKSRLAAEIYRERQARTLWCEAEGAVTADEVAARLANACGARLLGESEGGAHALGAAITKRADRLMIDGLDAVSPEIGALLSDLLRAAPDLRVLVTSRGGLGIAEEALVTVPPLDTSPDGGAAQLFLQRAGLVRADVASTAEERADLAALVRALDGLPLVIEIAAAQSRFMPIRMITEQLLSPQMWRAEDPLRSAIERALIGLPPESLAAFEALGVFRGGASREAMTHLLEAEGAPGSPARPAIEARPGDVNSPSFAEDRSPPMSPGLDGWTAIFRPLWQRSLVTAVAAGRSSRLVMLNPVRVIAESRLDAARAEQLRSRHAAFFVGLADRCTREEIADPPRALADLAIETDNLAAALERVTGPSDRLTLTLARAVVHQQTGPISAWLAALDAALASAPDAPIALKTRAIAILVGLAREMDRVEDVRARAETIAEEARASGDLGALAVAETALGETRTALGRFDEGARSLTIARDLARSERRPLREARALHALGVNRIEAGRLGEARLALREAIVILEGRDRILEARTLSVLGVVEIEEGRLAEARAWLDRALPIAEESGDRRLFALTTTNHAVVAHESGDLDLAIAEYERAADLCRAAGMRRGEALARAFLGHCHLERGEFSLARAAYEESLARLGREGWRRAMVLGPFAAAAAMEGDVDLAARALDEAEALFRTTGQSRLALAVPVCRGFLDLAESDRLRAQGDHAGAARHVESARARTQATLVDPTPRGSSAGPALAQQSTDLRVALRALRRAIAERTPAPAAPEPAWRVTSESGLLTSPTGDRVDLTRRAPLRRVLSRLVTERTERPGAVLSVETLVIAGWPGEEIAPKAGESRVYAAIATLRKLGLQTWLQSTGDGYRLDPGVPMIVGV